ncbi:hypothetical protein [Pseudomonas prosekii]|uniref:hypothetical protein n=1 Tax=Pseudomonas prosekii TaxID=1148509 RepID=UPI003F74D228
MTTIVWDTHSLSADSRETAGGSVTREKAKKIVQPTNSSVQFENAPLIAVAAAGGSFYVKPWLAFALGQSRTISELIKFIESGPLPQHAIYSLFVLTDSACFKFTAKPLNYAKSKVQFADVTNIPSASGSGGQFALPLVLDHGFLVAIARAARRDRGTNTYVASVERIPGAKTRRVAQKQMATAIKVETKLWRKLRIQHGGLPAPIKWCLIKLVF